MYLVIEETTFDTVSDLYIVKSQDESFSNAQKKKEALELLNEKENTYYYVCALPVKMQKTAQCDTMHNGDQVAIVLRLEN